MNSNAEQPMTPASASSSLDLDMLKSAHDSPLSGYYTDESRSPDQKHQPAFVTPHPAGIQGALARVNEIAAQLRRCEPQTDDLHILERSLSELESVVGLPTSERPLTRDSGQALSHCEFGDWDSTAHAEGLDNLKPAFHTELADITDAVPTNPFTHDSLLRDAQAVLERVTLANANLTTRFTELRDLNHHLADQAEIHARAEMRLQSENDSLRAVLVHDHSELLFLKLQLKSLEIQVGDVLDEEESHQASTPVRRIAESLDAFKSDWEDVDARLRSRREQFDIRLSGTPLSPFAGREDGKSQDDQGDWKVHVRKERKGHVESVIIRRLHGMRTKMTPYPGSLSDSADVAEKDDGEDGTDDEDEDTTDDGDEDANTSDSSVVIAGIGDDDPFVIKSPAENHRPHPCDSCGRGVSAVEASDVGVEDRDHEDRRPGAWREFMDSLTALTGASVYD